MSDVDIFDGIADTATPDTTPDVVVDATNDSEATETVPTSTEDAADNSTSTEGEKTAEGTETDTTPEPTVETVATVPDGAVSVTDFASFITQQLMREKIANGEDLDGSEYVVPQAVYQTVKAAKDRIPHILVKAEGEPEARVYILRDPALEWWRARRDRIATRGSGTTRASNRTPQENLDLLSAAVGKALYAADRLKMWQDKLDQNTKLVEKKKAMLATQNVDAETIELAVQEGTDTYNTEKAAKAAEKAKSDAKTAATEPSTDVVTETAPDAAIQSGDADNE